LTELLSVREAQEQILNRFSIRPSESIPLVEAYNRVLADDIHATQDMPPFTNSSMDGFAVRSQDVEAASAKNPVWLRVVQDIPAGTGAPRPLQAGEAARIMTGAPLPVGADSVIPVEDIDPSQVDGDGITIRKPLSAGAYIRPIGQDIRLGTPILPARKHLTPQDVALLASFGDAKVNVVSRPRVALFSSGDELVQPGQPLSPGKIYDSNHFMLTGLLIENGAQVLNLGTAHDDPQDIYDHLSSSLELRPDFILSSAGVSVGSYDYVRQIISQNGQIDFWRVNMRPGKPLAFGNFKGIPFIGLPGNPVSAFVGCLVFVLPVLRKLGGLNSHSARMVFGKLDEAVESDGRESYLRCQVTKKPDGYKVMLSGHQGSGNLFALTQANALLILPSGVKSLPAGSEVKVWVLTELVE
jgi:molybdopterin molybdotransferase